MLSSIRVIIVFTSIFVFALVAEVFSTGPSFLNVRLYPVSYNSGGFVLFKSTYEANPWGAHSPMRIIGKWMVVSPKGEIREYPYINYEPDYSGDNWDKTMEDYKVYVKELSSPVNWSNPPAGLSPLIKKYGFGEVKITLNEYTGTLNNYLKAKRPDIKTVPSLVLPIRSTRGLRSTLSPKSCKVRVFYSKGPLALVEISTGSLTGEPEELNHEYDISTSDRSVGKLDVFNHISMYGVVVLPEK